MENNGIEFERFIIQEIERHRDRSDGKITQKDLGIALGHSHVSNPAGVWQRYLKGSTSSGKPQRLNLADFINLSKAVGKDPIKYLTYLEESYNQSKK